MGSHEPTPNSSTPAPDTPSILAADSGMSHVDVSESHAPGSVPPSLSPLKLVRGGSNVPDLIWPALPKTCQPVHISVHCIAYAVQQHAVLCCTVIFCGDTVLDMTRCAVLRCMARAVLHMLSCADA